MLTINKIRWDHREFTQLAELHRILAARMTKHKLKVQIVPTPNGLLFKPLMGNRIVLSTVDNKVPLAPGDPRIERKGRDYLDTKRPTKDQWNAFWGTIQQTLDELNLYALVTFKDKAETVIRAGKVKSNPPNIKSYPVAK